MPEAEVTTCNPNTIDLEYPFGLPLQQLFCPACGKPIIELGTPFEEPQCKHVEWVYLDELGEFIFAQPPIQTVIDGLCEEEDEEGDVDDDVDFDLLQELQKAWSGKTKAVLTFTTGGMACGPVWSTVRFGLNFVPDESAPE